MPGQSRSGSSKTISIPPSFDGLVTEQIKEAVRSMQAKLDQEIMGILTEQQRKAGGRSNHPLVDMALREATVCREAGMSPSEIGAVFGSIRCPHAGSVISGSCWARSPLRKHFVFGVPVEMCRDCWNEMMADPRLDVPGPKDDFWIRAAPREIAKPQGVDTRGRLR